MWELGGGGVVVVAEMFRAGRVAECGALAAASVGEDVAADVASFGGWRLGPSGFWCKVLWAGDLGPDFGSGLGVPAG